ncbi:hypothetical protein [Flavobacterium sp. '19STA2R22 D10 B1']|uniref:hypothetical protein n=1 Tax=Flavobacterium aerium TaxID=3037261 RepID=UPI00278BE855|nr:hypothetical protein [Flavobacterium sp. '19STA2R22 D10 B1']
MSKATKKQIDKLTELYQSLINKDSNEPFKNGLLTYCSQILFDIDPNSQFYIDLRYRYNAKNYPSSLAIVHNAIAYYTEFSEK